MQSHIIGVIQSWWGSAGNRLSFRLTSLNSESVANISGGDPSSNCKWCRCFCSNFDRRSPDSTLSRIRSTIITNTLKGYTVKTRTHLKIKFNRELELNSNSRMLLWIGYMMYIDNQQIFIPPSTDKVHNLNGKIHCSVFHRHLGWWFARQ